MHFNDHVDDQLGFVEAFRPSRQLVYHALVVHLGLEEVFWPPE